jgi:hypothetical protein
MKKFKEVISENGPIPGGGQQATFGRNPAHGSFTPSVIKKVNAIIGSYVIEDLTDPMSALTRIRGSLSNIGLSFPAISDDMIYFGSNASQLNFFVINSYALLASVLQSSILFKR